MKGYLHETNEIRLLKRYADDALAVFSDPYHGTPLLMDLVHLGDQSPYEARATRTNIPSGNPFTIVSSNLIFQMHTLRLLVLLSRVTGDESYADRARAIIRYHYDHYTLRSGRMIWGTHHDVDLKTGKDVGYMHELKCEYPFYDLLFEVDPEKARTAIRAAWRGHVVNWGTMDLNRHAYEYDRFGHSLGTRKGLENIFKKPFADPPPFTPVTGLTFFNISSDLIYGAFKLYRWDGDEDALRWAQNLYGMYLKHRHPKTGLDSYTFGALVDASTYPMKKFTMGDRGYKQLFSLYGQSAYEGHLIADYCDDIYGGYGQVILDYRDKLGAVGEKMFADFAEGVSAFVKHLWDPEIHRFRPKFSDGTEYTDVSFPKGYFSSRPNKPFLLPAASIGAFLRVGFATDDEAVWNCARDVMRQRGLGDVGTLRGENIRVNLDTRDADELDAMTMLQLYRETARQEYLTLAETIYLNARRMQMAGGLFKSWDSRTLSATGTVTPLVGLLIEAEKQGAGDLLSDVYPSRHFTSLRR